MAVRDEIFDAPSRNYGLFHLLNFRPRQQLVILIIVPKKNLGRRYKLRNDW